MTPTQEEIKMLCERLRFRAAPSEHSTGDPLAGQVVDALKAQAAQVEELRAERDEFAITVVNLAGQRDEAIAMSSALNGDVTDFGQKLEAAEAENARLRALPLKDEVERVLEEGRKNAVAIMKALMAAGSRDNLLLADAVHRADDAARSLLSRLRAGEQEGWKLMPIEPTSEMLDAAIQAHEPLEDDDDLYVAEFKRTYRAMLTAAPSEHGGGDANR